MYKLFKSIYLWLTTHRDEKPRKIFQTSEEYYNLPKITEKCKT